MVNKAEAKVVRDREAEVVRDREAYRWSDHSPWCGL